MCVAQHLPLSRQHSMDEMIPAPRMQGHALGQLLLAHAMHGALLDLDATNAPAVNTPAANITIKQTRARAEEQGWGGRQTQSKLSPNETGRTLAASNQHAASQKVAHMWSRHSCLKMSMTCVQDSKTRRRSLLLCTSNTSNSVPTCRARPVTRPREQNTGLGASTEMRQERI